jgi:hypothetical protein
LKKHKKDLATQKKKEDAAAKKKKAQDIKA